jgi:hypothetical protein
MNATTGLRMVGTNPAAFCSKLTPISPSRTTAWVRGSSSSACSASRLVVPGTASPPMPMTADWP